MSVNNESNVNYLLSTKYFFMVNVSKVSKISSIFICFTNRCKKRNYL